MNPQAPSPFASMLIPLIVIYAIFYFLFMRPQKKEQKDRQNMINDLKKNDEIVTTGGIHGTIVNIKEKTFIIRVDDNAKLEIDKTVVAYIKRKSSE